MILPDHIAEALQLAGTAVRVLSAFADYHRRSCNQTELEELDAIVAPAREAYRHLTELVRGRTGAVAYDSLIVAAMQKVDAACGIALDKLTTHRSPN